MQKKPVKSLSWSAQSNVKHSFIRISVVHTMLRCANNRGYTFLSGDSFQSGSTISDASNCEDISLNGPTNSPFEMSKFLMESRDMKAVDRNLYLIKSDGT